MLLKRVTCASAIAIGVGVSALTAGVGLAAAQPGPPPCAPQGGTCQGPGGPGGLGGPGGPGGGMTGRTAVDRVDPVGLRVDLATATMSTTALQADLATATADRAAPVGPATGVVDRARQVTGAMVPVARVGRTVPHRRTSHGVGSIRVGTTTSHSTGMAAGCSPCSTPTSTTGAFGSLASGFRCDGLAQFRARRAAGDGDITGRISLSPSGQIRGGFCVSDAIGGHSPGCDGRRGHPESKRFSFRYRMHSPPPLRAQCQPIYPT